MKLTGRQKCVFEEYGQAWLYYMGDTPLFNGTETAEQREKILTNRNSALQMGVAIDALCEALGVFYQIERELGKNGWVFYLIIFDGNTGEMVMKIAKPENID